MLSPSALDLWVNALWFTSLTLSLVDALIAVLARQWLAQYMSLTSGTAHERSRMRHYRFTGLQAWNVPLVIELLPFIMHASLALFLAGLVLSLRPLSNAIAYVVGGITGATYMAYIISMLLPLRYPQCPYKTPLTIYLYHTLQWLFKLIRLLPIFAKPSSSLPLTRSDLESQHIFRDGQKIDEDIIRWLYTITANASVKRIAIRAVGGFDGPVTPTLRPVLHRDILELLKSCHDKRWNTQDRSTLDRYFPSLLNICDNKVDSKYTDWTDIIHKHPKESAETLLYLIEECFAGSQRNMLMHPLQWLYLFQQCVEHRDFVRHRWQHEYLHLSVIQRLIKLYWTSDRGISESKEALKVISRSLTRKTLSQFLDDQTIAVYCASILIQELLRLMLESQNEDTPMLDDISIRRGEITRYEPLCHDLRAANVTELFRCISACRSTTTRIESSKLLEVVIDPVIHYTPAELYEPKFFFSKCSYKIKLHLQHIIKSLFLDSIFMADASRFLQLTSLSIAREMKYLHGMPSFNATIISLLYSASTAGARQPEVGMSPREDEPPTIIFYTVVRLLSELPSSFTIGNYFSFEVTYAVMILQQLCDKSVEIESQKLSFFTDAIDAFQDRIVTTLCQADHLAGQFFEDEYLKSTTFVRICEFLTRMNRLDLLLKLINLDPKSWFSRCRVPIFTVNSEDDTSHVPTLGPSLAYAIICDADSTGQESNVDILLEALYGDLGIETDLAAHETTVEKARAAISHSKFW